MDIHSSLLLLSISPVRNNLHSIAKEVSRCIKTEALGKKLGFKNSQIKKYLKSNKNSTEPNYESTLLILREWLKTVPDTERNSRLRSALEKANLTHIAEKHRKKG